MFSNNALYHQTKVFGLLVRPKNISMSKTQGSLFLAKSVPTKKTPTYIVSFWRLKSKSLATKTSRRRPKSYCSYNPVVDWRLSRSRLKVTSAKLDFFWRGIREDSLGTKLLVAGLGQIFRSKKNISTFITIGICRAYLT